MPKRKYLTVNDAMKTEIGKLYYKILTQEFERCINRSPAIVKAAMLSGTCYLGSQACIEHMVFELLNAEEK